MIAFQRASSRPNVGIRTSSHGRIVMGPCRNAYNQSGCTFAPSGVSSGGASVASVDHRAVIAAIAFDLVAADAVLPPHERAPADGVVALGRPRRQRRGRLHVALEAHDGRLQPLILRLGEVEVGHPQLLERLEHAALIERARILQLLMEPVEL